MFFYHESEDFEWESALRWGGQQQLIWVMLQPKALFDFIGIGDCDGIVPSLPFRLGEYSPNLAI